MMEVPTCGDCGQQHLLANAQDLAFAAGYAMEHALRRKELVVACNIVHLLDYALRDQGTPHAERLAIVGSLEGMLVRAKEGG